MFWIIAAVVIVALGALAWWTSGRAGALPRANHDGDAGQAEGKSRWQIGGANSIGKGDGSPFGF